MTIDDALETINAALNVSAAVTHRGDEVKCYIPNEGVVHLSKTYLDAAACAELARAFDALAASLTRS